MTFNSNLPLPSDKIRNFPGNVTTNNWRRLVANINADHNFQNTAGGVGSPLIQEWGYVLAYGAALEFFRQRGQLDQLASYQSSYDFYLDRAIGHWGQQATNQRSLTKW